MSLYSDLYDLLLSLSPGNIQKLNKLSSELDWYRQNDAMKSALIVQMQEEINAIREASLGVPVTAPAKTKAISTSLDMCPILYAHPTISKSYLGIWGGEYQAVSKSEFLRFVQVAKINTLPYQANYHECAKFAYGLLGAFCNTKDWWDTPVGVIESAGHVQNTIFYFEDEDTEMTELKFGILEPQNNTLLPSSTITGLVSCVLMG